MNNTQIIKQAALRQGVRSTLASLLEAPESAMEVAVQPRNASGSGPLVTASGAGGPGLALIASHDIFVILSPPVRPSLCCCNGRGKIRLLLLCPIIASLHLLQ